MKITKMLSAGLMLLCAGAAVYGSEQDSSGSTVKKSILPYHTPYTVRAAGYGLSTLGFGAGAISGGINSKSVMNRLKEKVKAFNECSSSDSEKKKILRAEIRELRKSLLLNLLTCVGSSLICAGSLGEAAGNIRKSYKVAKSEKNNDRNLWKNRQKQSRLSQIFSTAPFEKTLGDHISEKKFSNFDQDIARGHTQTIPSASHDTSVHAKTFDAILQFADVQALEGAKRSQLLAQKLSPGLTVLNIDGD